MILNPKRNCVNVHLPYSISSFPFIKKMEITAHCILHVELYEVNFFTLPSKCKAFLYLVNVQTKSHFFFRLHCSHNNTVLSDCD
jgi:hypothetical protein